jgi:hypothetical protein
MMPKTKQDLFEKYNVNDSHSEWNDRIDNWTSVEIFRLMHNGRLPEPDDTSFKYITDFADKFKNNKEVVKLRERRDFGSLYLTTKRLIYMHWEGILLEIN